MYFCRQYAKTNILKFRLKSMLTLYIFKIIELNFYNNKIDLHGVEMDLEQTGPDCVNITCVKLVVKNTIKRLLRIFINRDLFDQNVAEIVFFTFSNIHNFHRLCRYCEFQMDKKKHKFFKNGTINISFLWILVDLRKGMTPKPLNALGRIIGSAFLLHCWHGKSKMLSSTSSYQMIEMNYHWDD